MHKLFYYGIALIGLLFYSCDEDAKLGKSISGEWESTPIELQGVDATSANVTENYMFVPDSTNLRGNVMITGMWSVITAPSMTNNIEQPISITVSGKSIAYGKWMVDDNDELAMQFALDSISVMVDPDIVKLDNNIVTNQNSVLTDSISPATANIIKAQVLSSLQARYASFRKLNDVKVKGNEMKFDVLENEYHLYRETTF